MTGKSYLSRVALTGFFATGLAFFAAKPARADRDDAGACRARLESARARLDRDVARHGDNGPRVQRDQQRLEDARRWCRDHHADWDHDRYDNDHREDRNDDDHHEEHHDDHH